MSERSENPAVPYTTESLNFQPKTVAEKLDATETREEFLNVLQDLFSSLDKARLEETDE